MVPGAVDDRGARGPRPQARHAADPARRMKVKALLPTGHCFDDAIEFLLRYRDDPARLARLRLVHGIYRPTAETAQTPDLVDKRIAHAWVEEDDVSVWASAITDTGVWILLPDRPRRVLPDLERRARVDHALHLGRGPPLQRRHRALRPVARRSPGALQPPPPLGCGLPDRAPLRSGVSRARFRARPCTPALTALDGARPLYYSSPRERPIQQIRDDDDNVARQFRRRPFGGPHGSRIRARLARRQLRHHGESRGRVRGRRRCGRRRNRMADPPAGRREWPPPRRQVARRPEQVRGGRGGGALSRRLFVAVYRTGGLLNFNWRRTEAFDAARAEAIADGLRRMGYPTHVVDYDRSLAVGLPETFSGGAPIADEWIEEGA